MQVNDEVETALARSRLNVAAFPDASIEFQRVHARATEPGQHPFDTWYHRELRSQRAGQNVRRLYGSVTISAFLAIGERADAALAPPSLLVASGPAARVEQFIAEPIGSQRRVDGPIDPLEAPIVYTVLFRVPDNRADEFDRWYGDEHVPLLLGCKHWLMSRRFRVRGNSADGWTRLTLHYLADIDALDSPERALGRRTPWRDRLTREPWFPGENVVHYRLPARAPCSAREETGP